MTLSLISENVVAGATSPESLTPVAFMGEGFRAVPQPTTDAAGGTLTITDQSADYMADRSTVSYQYTTGDSAWTGDASFDFDGGYGFSSHVYSDSSSLSPIAIGDDRTSFLLLGTFTEEVEDGTAYVTVNATILSPTESGFEASYLFLEHDGYFSAQGRRGPADEDAYALGDGRVGATFSIRGEYYEIDEAIVTLTHRTMIFDEGADGIEAIWLPVSGPSYMLAAPDGGLVVISQSGPDTAVAPYTVTLFDEDYEVVESHSLDLNEILDDNGLTTQTPELSAFVDEAGDLQLMVTDGANDTEAVQLVFDLPDAPDESITALTDGDDVFSGSFISETVYGEDGDDHLMGRDGADELYGGEGNDTIRGGSGDDGVVDINTEDQAGGLYGGEGDDFIRGNRGQDDMFGGAGNDDMNGGFGDDNIDGGEGDDKMSGFDGADEMYGGAGNDMMHGGRGDDVMFGGEGDDVLRGADGADQLWASGGGADLLIGDDGADAFGTSGDLGEATVKDFTLGADVIASDAGIAFADIVISQDGKDALVQVGDSTLRLVKVDSTQLSEADFLFLDPPVEEAPMDPVEPTEPMDPMDPSPIVGDGLFLSPEESAARIEEGAADASPPEMELDGTYMP